jgi:hypothetical protein
MSEHQDNFSLDQIEHAITDFKIKICRDCSSADSLEIHFNENYETELMQLVIGFQQLISLYYKGKTQRRVEKKLTQNERKALLEIYKITTYQDLRAYRDRILNNHN